MLTLLKKRPIIKLFLITSSLFIFVWKIVRCHRFDCERVSSLHTHAVLVFPHFVTTIIVIIIKKKKKKKKYIYIYYYHENNYSFFTLFISFDCLLIAVSENSSSQPASLICQSLMKQKTF